jgi:hypothetical protein
MNQRRIQIWAFSYIGEKIAQGATEAALSDESGMEMPETFSGWWLDFCDFEEWAHQHYIRDPESVRNVFNCVHTLLGLDK